MSFFFKNLYKLYIVYIIDMNSGAITDSGTLSVTANHWQLVLNMAFYAS
jgi:hypothetical protein